MSRSELYALAQRIGAEHAAPHASDVDTQSRFPHEGVAALKDARLLSAFVPVEYGGMGVGMLELAEICEALGEHCSATGMVYAMHQTQVVSLVRHVGDSAALQGYLRELAAKQLLIASVTSEVGIGGDMRSSLCAVEVEGGRYRLAKAATTISYGAHADDLMITARRDAASPANDQVLVLARGADTQLERTSNWDTMGMRGTCSTGFNVVATGAADQVVPVEFATIASQSMVPVSHVVWASLWLGMATGAVNKARAFVRAAARKTPGTLPPTATRLAEVMNALQTMRSNVHDVARDADERMRSDLGALSTMGFAVKINNLKISASEQVVQIIHQAMQICGISAYKNDTPYSLGRVYRDALSASLMVGNDRIYATNAQLALVMKEQS